MGKIHISEPSISHEELESIRQPLESGWLTQGRKVAQFEEQFAELHDADFGIAVTSCTTALQLVLTALNIGEGDEVIIPSFSWIATANVVEHCGATPVFVDVDQVTFNISVEHVQTVVSPRTKAIIPVHLFGLCADIEGLKAVLPDSVHIIEDAACAAGAYYKGKPAGTLGIAGCFSFHPRKSITTGEGGMITSNHTDLANKIRSLRNHGASVSEEERHAGSQPYLLPEFNELGFNYRMTDLQGAVGVAQVKKLKLFVKERAKWARWYREKLSDIGWLKLPQEPHDGNHAWQAFVTSVDPLCAPLPRNEIMRVLNDKGVSTRPGTHAIHMLGYYKDKYGFHADMLPNARDCANNTMAIPLHNKMTEDDYNYVVDCIRAIR